MEEMDVDAPTLPPHAFLVPPRPPQPPQPPPPQPPQQRQVWNHNIPPSTNANKVAPFCFSTNTLSSSSSSSSSLATTTPSTTTTPSVFRSPFRTNTSHKPSFSFPNTGFNSTLQLQPPPPPHLQPLHLLPSPSPAPAPQQQQQQQQQRQELWVRRQPPTQLPQQPARQSSQRLPPQQPRQPSALLQQQQRQQQPPQISAETMYEEAEDAMDEMGSVEEQVMQVEIACLNRFLRTVLPQANHEKVTTDGKTFYGTKSNHNIPPPDSFYRIRLVHDDDPTPTLTSTNPNTTTTTTTSTVSTVASTSTSSSLSSSSNNNHQPPQPNKMKIIVDYGKYLERQFVISGDLDLGASSTSAVARTRTLSVIVSNSQGLTEEQKQALPVRMVTSTEKTNTPSCCICLCDYEERTLIKILPCGHFFHPSCIDTSLTRNKKCPLCRAPVQVLPSSSSSSTSRT